jgi:hypothetical protein
LSEATTGITGKKERGSSKVAAIIPAFQYDLRGFVATTAAATPNNAALFIFMWL